MVRLTRLLLLGNMGQLGKRLIFSAIFVTLSIVTIFWIPSFLFFVVIEIFILLALNEFLTLVERKGIQIQRPLSLFFGALIPFSFYFPILPVILVCACISYFVLHFRKELNAQALFGTGIMIFGLVYIAWFFSHILPMRQLPHGAWWVFYTVLLVKGGDGGAYFIGRVYGKHKLIEHVSPNKSIEGAVAEMVTILILSVISKIYLPHVPILNLVILGLVIGVIAQIGDLGESLIKREVDIKDSGTIPGLGGFLDMLDSLLLTVPIAFYYILLFIGSA